MNRITQQVVIEAHQHIGEKETARNSSPKIDDWLRRVGCKPGDPWCAAFAWCMLDDAIRALGLTNCLPPTAGVHKLFLLAHQYHAWWTEPSPGCVFGIDHGKGLGHCGIVIDVDGERLVTIEGNTNEAGSREGNAVVVKTRTAKECDLGYLDPGLLLVGQTCSEAHPEDG